VEGPLEDSGLIEGSRQGDPRIPVCTEWIVSKAVGSTLRRGLVTHEGCEHQIHSNQVVDKIVNVPVSARGRRRPLFVANSGDQVIDGRHGAAELIPKRWRWSHQRPPLSPERERTLQDRGGYDANLVIDLVSFHRRRPARPGVAMRSRS